MDEERAQELLRRNKANNVWYIRNWDFVFMWLAMKTEVFSSYYLQMVSAAFQSSYAIETNSVPILHEDAVKGRLLDPLPLFSPITVLSPIAIPNKVWYAFLMC